MPRIFTQHWGGRRPFSCEKCGTFITNRDEVVSSNFRGFRGAALLVYRAANIKKGERTKRIMKSGKYIVRDVQCIICETALGWFYEFSSNEAQRYKEGKLVLERTLLRESEVTCPKLAERKATPTSFQGESNDSEVPAKSV